MRWLDRARALLGEAADHPNGEHADADRQEGEEHRGDVAGDAFNGGDGGGHIGIIRGMGGGEAEEAEGREEQEELGLVHFVCAGFRDRFRVIAELQSDCGMWNMTMSVFGVKKEKPPGF